MSRRKSEEVKSLQTQLSDQQEESSKKIETLQRLLFEEQQKTSETRQKLTNITDIHKQGSYC